MKMENRILKLHNPTGHPYWNRDEYKVELPNGEMLQIDHLYYDGGGYRIYESKEGVYLQPCICGSGYGKVDWEGMPVVLIVLKREYDKIEYVGSPLVMSEELKSDLKDNQIENV